MLESGLQFNPILPIWLLLPLLLAGVYVSWFTYSRVKQSSLIKSSLIILRSISFLILFLLLFQSQFLTEKVLIQKSSLAILLDNSESSTIQNGSYKGLESYKPILNSIVELDTSEVSIELFSAGTHLKSIQSIEELGFSEGETDLFDAFSTIAQSEKEYSAIVLVSDGIYTINRDPIYAIPDISFPVYSIALGDTIAVKDIILKKVNSPSIAYKNAPFQVPITIQKSGYDSNIPLVIRISENEKVLAKKTINFAKDLDYIIDTLSITPTEIGINRWKIEIQNLSDEFTNQNNRSSFTVRVLDNKNRITHIAFSIHPDVKTVRSVIQEIENAELISRTWIGKSSFLEGNLTGLMDSTQLLILHGYPSINLPDALKLQLDNWIAQTPTIFIDLPLQQRAYLSSTGIDKKPIQSSSTGSLTPLGLSFNELELNHPILELPEIDESKLKIIGYSQGDQIKQGSRILMYYSQSSIPSTKPAVAILQDADRRYSQIGFHNFYQLYQHGNEEQLFIKRLLKNTIEWTSTKLTNSLLEIQLPKRDIQENEAFELSAFVKNESLQPISNAIVTLQVNRIKEQITSTTLANVGSGNYSKLLGPFSDGVYQFTATASLNDKVIDTETGSFTVSAITNEYRSIKRNTQTLTNLSELTSGKTSDFSNADSFLKSLIQDLSTNKRVEYQLEEWFLIDSIWWLIALAMSLSSEWFIRKIKAMP